MGDTPATAWIVIVPVITDFKSYKVPQVEVAVVHMCIYMY